MQSFKKGGMRTNDFKKSNFHFVLRYIPHRVKCIEANKLLSPAERLSLKTLVFFKI